MAFRIFPRDEGFFPLLEESSVIAHDCAKRISGILRSLPPAEVEIDAIMAAERRADEIVRELHRRLECSLVTPFDREDLQVLMTKLDDVVDEILAAADSGAKQHLRCGIWRTSIHARSKSSCHQITNHVVRATNGIRYDGGKLQLVTSKLLTTFLCLSPGLR